MLTTRYFTINLGAHNEESVRKKIRRHWFDKRPLNQIFDETYEAVEATMGLKLYSRPSIPVEMVDQLEKAGMNYNISLKFKFSEFTANVLQHEIVHAIIDITYATQQRIPVRMEEVLAQYVDSQL